MNDKLKGLLAGLSIGLLLSGTAAYAENEQIGVVFRDLKYMIDGVQKAPATGKGFIYNGTTYVPIRFISEALGKPVEWDEADSTIWIGDKTAATTVVATYKGGQVTKGEFAVFLALQSLLNPSYAQYETSADYQQYMIKNLIMVRVLASRADGSALSAAETAADGQFNQLAQSAGQDALEQKLAKQKLVVTDLRAFLLQNELARSALRAAISEAALQDAYAKHLQADKDYYTVASVRHILVALNDANGKALRTDDEAHKRALEVQGKLQNGEDFAALAKEYSDDPGSKDNGGLYENARINGYVAEFKQAAAELPIGQISDPVKTQYGYHIIKVESRSVQPWTEVKTELQTELLDGMSKDFATKELPGLIESINLPNQ